MERQGSQQGPHHQNERQAQLGQATTTDCPAAAPEVLLDGGVFGALRATSSPAPGPELQPVRHQLRSLDAAGELLHAATEPHVVYVYVQIVDVHVGAGSHA